MEVKKGYKQTELGVIPEDWEIKSINESCTYRRGSFPQPYGLSKWYDDVNGAPFVQVFDIDDNWKIKDETKRYISKIAQLQSVFTKKGTIVLTIQGSIGRIAITQYDAYIDRTLLIFETFKLKINKIYFSYAIESVFEKEKQNAPGGIIKTITKVALSSFLIPLPALPEQTAIATALSDMDALITQTEKLIEKKKAMKQGMMQELLKPKKGWITKKLGEIFEYEQPSKYIVTETTYNPFNEIPVLTAGKSFLLGYTSETFGVFQQIPVIIFDDFTTSCQYVDFKFKVKSSAIKILKPASVGINLPLAYELLKNIDYQVGDHKRHWIGEFINFEILIPSSPEEQNRIGRIIEDLLNEIAFYQSKLQKLKLQKQGMMQELLTGRIRLL